jgi:hypothetical protein
MNSAAPIDRLQCPGSVLSGSKTVGSEHPHAQGLDAAPGGVLRRPRLQHESA